jgi:hypothetical protein
MTKPAPIDLVPYAHLVEQAQEFARQWRRADGAIVSFVNPLPLGPDPANFGIALVECIRQAAETYAKAVNISAEQAIARIWQGVDAERAQVRDPNNPEALLEI